MRTENRPPWLLLASIMAVGIGLRVGVAYSLGDGLQDLPGTYDQLSYDTLARRVLAGEGFTFPTRWWPATRAGEPTAHWSYLYTLYLTAVYGLFHGHVMAARLLQAVVAGVLYPWFAWRIGARLFGPLAGLVAAALTAGYGYFVYYAGALMTETLYILAILWALDVALGIAQTQAPGAQSAGVRRALDMVGPWLLLGLALGMAALLRQLVLVFVPFLMAWLLWARLRHRQTVDSVIPRAPWRPVMGGLLLTTMVIALLILPWTVHNYQAFGRLVLLNTNAGYAFFWANHPVHGTNFVSILPEGTYQRLIPPELRGLDEAALDQALLGEGVRFVLDDPARYALLSVSRVKDYFRFWPSPESSATSNLGRTFSFGLYLPLIVYGSVLAAMRYRSAHASGTWAGIVLLYSFAAVYSLMHLLSWALIRYRLPVDAVLLPFAGLAVVDLADRVLARLRCRGQRRDSVQQPTATAS
jgi:4-amino-4-deoxy-L-arabinose transferase-like glycosyltransferase